ncbi:hypothetical protein BJV78DRAFT_1211640 [Lactifluus subvellereus]|nr:hypothetical protein BJV78DRAFT_1211640 [Lactifluus subvellereus]
MPRIEDPHHKPTLPVELSYQIIEEAWSLPLSRTERRDLLVALPSVCRSFRSIADHVFLRDAHISADPPLTWSESSDADAERARAPCCSVTFHIYDPSSSPSSGYLRIYGPPCPTTGALETTLRALTRDAAALAPALARVALHYTGWSFTHELDHARLAHLPPHVRSLELHFATPAAFARHLRQSYSRHYVIPIPGVRTLRVYGTCPGFVIDVARACPALESLETDDARGVLALQPSLRPFILQSADDDTQMTGAEPPVWGGVQGKVPEVLAHLRVKAFGELREKPSHPQGSSKRKPARI